MNRFVLISVAVLLTVSTGCRDSSISQDEDPIPTQQRITVSLDHQFEIGLGEVVSLEGTDIEVTFSAITHDYRCASDVVCVHAGEAGIALAIVDTVTTHSQVSLTIPGLVLTPYRHDNAFRFRDWDFRLMRLDPYPISTERPDNSEFRALVVIESIFDQN